MEKNFNVKDGIYAVKSEEGGYIAVGDTDTCWEVRFGKDLVMYKSLDSFMGGDDLDEEGRACILGLVIEWFGDTNTLWDAEYIKEKRKAMKAYFKRVVKKMKKSGVKDEDIALVGSFLGEA